MSASAFIVLLGLFGTLMVLMLDRMRPGFTLLSAAIIFMVTGVISPGELLEGFSSKEMITIAMLFLIAEGVRSSGSLYHLLKFVLPTRRGSVGSLLARVLPAVTAISMALNNTAVVVIFAPIIKSWAERLGLSATKFLIPLSYAAIMGGLCTLIGTSTNLVVNGLMVESGFRSLGMFEIGKVGLVIALVGILYLVCFSALLLPDRRVAEEDDSASEDEHRVEVILNSRFPGVGKSLGEFNFYRHYGARVIALRRNGESYTKGIESYILTQGDTLTLVTDADFTHTWRESSAFYIISGEEPQPHPHTSRRRWLGIGMLLFMMLGASLGEGYALSFNGVKLDMFFFAATVMVAMALTQLFPVKRYTKFVSWDVLVAIASAFAISKAMTNSGINTLVAEWILSMPQLFGLYGVLALLYLITMLLTELITNNAAVAIAFPVALALAERLGVDPMPFFIAICIAASASFSSPIGYQTNLIVQGVGGYKFKDYLRIGIGLNIITLVISVLLIPRIWSF
ncbi:MAG: SLC13 family permease [Rikenellaceae bacterium]